MNRLLITLVLLSTFQTTLADTCPPIRSVQQGTAQGWLAYDADNGKLLSKKRDLALRKSIEKFALAEWSAKLNAIHCYYRDKNGSDLDAYFSKSHFQPAKANPYWYSVSGFMQCAAGEKACNFTTEHA